MKVKIWLISWLIIVISVLSVFGYWVYRIDPYFHYHKPETDKYYYTLNNQRSQNDGISKYFNYDALITGTSMIENSRTTETDRLFGCHSIKVCYEGGSYKEVNDNVKNALKANGDLKIVIRCLDMGRFLDPYDKMRKDLGRYPTYLYDNNPFNDVEYLLNRDVVFGRTYRMILDREKEDFEPGITSFDEYSRWQNRVTFGINTVAPEGITVKEKEQVHLSEEDKEVIKKNIELNVTGVADEYPNVDFYYFYSPYSVAEWNKWRNSGTLYKMLEAEKYITEMIIPHKNIHLFSFNNRTDITTDLNHYKDRTHFAAWISSLILKWMHDGQGQLTEENYRDRLKQEYEFYTTFDYAGVNGQEDYEDDYYAGALLNQELTGARALDVLHDKEIDAAVSGADYRYDEKNQPVIVCRGALSRESGGEDLAEYLRDREFIGLKFRVDLDDGYNYLVFNGQKIADQGRLTAYVYDSDGELVGKKEANYKDLDNEVHQYVLDLSAVDGIVTVVLNGGCIDSSGNADSEYQFSNIYMY